MAILTREDLHEHLKTAIELEHATIPTYLCALYSIKDGHNLEAAEVIRSVVMEEMLHMTMAANLLNAVGGTPEIDQPGFIPAYPTYLPHSDQAFVVNLLKFSPEALDTFLKIEKPEDPGTPPKDEDYSTIGQFYDSIKQAMVLMDRDPPDGKPLFCGDPAYQVGAEHYYGGGGEALEVTDLKSALAVIDEVVEQGEGHGHTIFDPDHHDFGQEREYAHYFRFNEIYTGRSYQEGDTPESGPTGPEFPVDWNAVYNMRPNPKAEDFPVGSEIRELTDEFNRTYTRLLQLVEKAFQGEPSRLMEAVKVMYDLKYKAVALMKIPVGDGTTAGPTFQYLAESE